MRCDTCCLHLGSHSAAANIGTRFAGHRRKPVVVAVTDLVRRYRIVFVDDGNHRTLEKARQGAARIQETTAIFGVVGSKQHLRRAYPVHTECFLVSMYELYLSCGRRRLQVFKPRSTLVNAEHVTANGYRSRRDDQDIVSPPLQAGNIVCERFQPCAVEAPILINEQ